MKLDKAIEIGHINLKEAGSKMPPDCRTSLFILVQAAEYIRDTRVTTPGVMPTQLPGESID